MGPAASRPTSRRRSSPPGLERFAAAPGLEERIRAFWDDGEACFTEMFVVAERGGVLFENDPERLWAGLAEGAAAAAALRAAGVGDARGSGPLPGPPGPSARRRRPAGRAGWSCCGDTWAAIEAQWQAEGRDAAEALAWEIRTKVPEVGSYADLVPLVQGCDFGGLLPRLVARAAAGGQEVVLAPAWLGRKGFLVALADCLLWGPPSPSRPAGPSAETRDRARRYKALGDPTRLAIFEATARRPRTVGELARELGVAQPTVSNHVRILRDAGLLDQEKGEGGGSWPTWPASSSSRRSPGGPWSGPRREYYIDLA